MPTPPTHIDGAQVLEWAWSDRPFGQVQSREDGHAVPIHGLAICSYGSPDEVYRFSCGPDWACEQDEVYLTVAQAKSDLPRQYRDVDAFWQTAT
ncbi:hypothetical protein ACQ86G_14235 [Roseateles chitinivorans]|uniref:hypothetical protein n=1 Tax=Roseateles chitinivorans TaxID=2917965 RepID=UPI003D678086